MYCAPCSNESGVWVHSAQTVPHTSSWIQVPPPCFFFHVHKYADQKGLGCHAGHQEVSRCCTRGESEYHHHASFSMCTSSQIKKGSDATLAIKRLVGVALEVNLRNLLHGSHKAGKPGNPPLVWNPGQPSPEVQNRYQWLHKKDWYPPNLKKDVWRSCVKMGDFKKNCTLLSNWFVCYTLWIPRRRVSVDKIISKITETLKAKCNQGTIIHKIINSQGHGLICITQSLKDCYIGKIMPTCIE